MKGIEKCMFSRLSHNSNVPASKVKMGTIVVFDFKTEQVVYNTDSLCLTA